MLNASDLISMHNDESQLLLDTCTLKRMTGTPRVLTTITSSLPCTVTVDQRKNQSNEMAELDMGVQTYTLIVPYTTVLYKEDQITHGGHVYEVRAVQDDETPLLFKTATMTRVSA